MKISTKQSTSYRRCKFPGCGNLFVGHHLQRFCNQPECVAARRKKYYETRKGKLTKQLKRKSALNIVLHKPELKGRVLEIHCAAKGVNGRCPSKFHVVYTSGQRVYPRYCPEHRNEYKRHRFENVKRIRNAENTNTSIASGRRGDRASERPKTEETET